MFHGIYESVKDAMIADTKNGGIAPKYIYGMMQMARVLVPVVGADYWPI